MGEAPGYRHGEPEAASAGAVFRELILRAQDNGYRMNEVESKVIKAGFSSIFFRELLGGCIATGAVLAIGRYFKTPRPLRFFGAVFVGLSSAGWMSHFERERLVKSVTALENSPVAIETKIILAEVEGLQGPFQRRLEIQPIDFQAFGLTVYDFVQQTDDYLGLCELIPDDKRVGRPSKEQRDRREATVRGPPPRNNDPLMYPPDAPEWRAEQAATVSPSTGSFPARVAQDDARGSIPVDGRSFEPADVWNVDAYAEDRNESGGFQTDVPAAKYESPAEDPHAFPENSSLSDTLGQDPFAQGEGEAAPQLQDLKPSQRRALERQARRERASRNE
ncbi:hypothetical protein FVE85_6385 [Porphyridium purpureum]|uniref:Transmembrane protein n=1 Tax=Porphyridium purpureum TaxID=35688 RepID=A0A5J4Z6D9_PORPP|nr:hypothetical protein FVE85_6385 [Porphyridium purpureum]|eukprot:POR2871..scf295_1